jgi:hypothetical protein
MVVKLKPEYYYLNTFFFNVGVQVSLCAPRLISRALKLSKHVSCTISWVVISYYCIDLDQLESIFLICDPRIKF